MNLVYDALLPFGNYIGGVIYLLALVSIVIFIKKVEQNQNTGVKHFFFNEVVSLLIYFLGVILELTSKNIEQSILAYKIIYFGSILSGMFALVFALDYCDIKINNWIYIIWAGIIFAFIYLVFLSDSSKFFISSYNYAYIGDYFRYVNATPDFGFFIFHIFNSLEIGGSIFIIVYHHFKNTTNYTKRLISIAIAILFPFVGEVTYTILKAINPNMEIFFLTPLTLVPMIIVLGFGIYKINVFNISDENKIDSVDNISTCYVLLDNNNGYLYSNAVSKKIFSGIELLYKGQNMSKLKSWPASLLNYQYSPSAAQVDFQIEDRSYRAYVSKVINTKSDSYSLAYFIQDITESLKIINQLEQYAYLDPLLKINNRRSFFDLVAAKKINTEKYKYFILMIDIDFFKKINDKYGHLIGDEVLIKTSNSISTSIRETDVLARYGGEEFVIFSYVTSLDEIKYIAHRIRSNIKNNIIKVNQELINLTVSIGISKFDPKDGISVAIDNADKALYVAKETGRNKVSVYKEEEI
jgi:diguanylate cyclase (GGDEF)-like protein